MAPLIQRHGQNYSHINPEQWAGMKGDFDKAEASILKKIEKGEYSNEFGTRLLQTMKQKYDGHASLTGSEDDGMVRSARVGTDDVKEILQAIVDGEIPGRLKFMETLETNKIGDEEFFKVLSLMMRRSDDDTNIQAWISKFDGWGYGYEVQWLRATLDPLGGGQKDPGAPKAPETAPEAAPEAPGTPKPAPTPPGTPSTAPKEHAEELPADLGEKIKKLRTYPWGAEWRKWRITLKNRQTGETQSTDRTLSPRGVEMNLRQLENHKVFELVNLEDLGPAGRKASGGKWMRIAQTEETMEKFKAGSPIIFTRDVQLSFDALNAKGKIKENMTGKVKKVLDEGYMIDIAGQIYIVPKSAAEHVMDLFVGEVVGGGESEGEVEIEDQTEQPEIPAEMPAAEPAAVGAEPGILSEETVEIPPNAIQPGTRASATGMERAAAPAQPMNVPGKCTLENLNEEVEEKEISRCNIEEDPESHHGNKNLRRDPENRRGPAGQRSAPSVQASESMASLLKQIENDAPGVPSDIGRRLYHQNGATREGIILPNEGGQENGKNT